MGEGKTLTLSEEHKGKWIKFTISYKDKMYETKPLYVYGEDKATINVPELQTAFSMENVYRQEIYPYDVTIKSETGDNYTIDAGFGKKKYSESVYVEQGEEVTLNLESEPDNGFQPVSIAVKNSAGAVLAEYNNDINVLPPVIDAYLAPFTRKMGLAGALSVSEANDVAQLNTHRLEFLWAPSETTKGKYNIDFKENIENAKAADSEIIALVDYNNKIYNGKKSITSGILTKENLDAYVNFAKAIQEKYSEDSPISYFEIWNEPNASLLFWTDADRVTDYMYLAEVSKRELLKNNPKEKTAAGATAGGDYLWINQLLEGGLYPNMDAISNHPYIWNYLVDEKYNEVLSGMTGVITEYGGWKEQIITEVGWPTHTDGITKEQQAIELVKQVVAADYYDIPTNQYYRSADDFLWEYYDETNPENNFGVFYHGRKSLKPSAFSISNLNYETIGAVFAGKLPFQDENIEAYLYARDKEITCIIWTKGDDTQVSFEGETLSAVDINGNYIGAGNTFVIGEAPIYIHGLSYKHIINALPENIRDYIDLYISLSFEQSEGRKGFDEAKALLYSSAELAEGLPENITETQALEALENHYAVNIQLINMYKDGELDISQAQLNGLLYVNQWGANILSVIYMLAADENSLDGYELLGASKILEAQSAVNNKSGENTLSYSSAILAYAEKFAEKAAKLAEKEGTNPLKCGAVKAWDRLAYLIAQTAECMAEAESVGYDNVIIQLPSSQWELISGQEKIIYISVYNYRPNAVLNGKLELVSPSGTIVSGVSDVSVNAQKSAKISMSVCLDSLESGTYAIRFTENEKVIAERTAKIHM